MSEAARIAPEGTFLAPVRAGHMQFPQAIHDWCLLEGWSLFRFTIADRDHVVIHPVMPGEREEFHACLDADGRLWIPAEFREKIELGEQSVMLRIENGAIRMFLRRVFEALGFRPA